MSDFRTTEQIARMYSYAYAWRSEDGEDQADLSDMRNKQAEEFHAWLAEHDREKQAQAWEEGATAQFCDVDPVNPYRQGDNK